MSAVEVELHVLAVSLSMAVTPLLFLVYDRFARQAVDKPLEFDAIEDSQAPVLIIGFGRFGQVVGACSRREKFASQHWMQVTSR
jgi:hypothetical protein